MRQEQSTDGGTASVECDSTRQVAEANASYGAGPTDRGVSVASSSFHAKAWRDPKFGVVSESVAEADGVKVSSPSGGISIGRVVAQAQTLAHGHTGTTRVTWVRSLDDVAITDGSGHPAQSLGGCQTVLERKGGQGPPRVTEDTCARLARELNDVTALRARIDLFTPGLDATPKGAFAGIQQTDAEYYQGVTVNSQGVVYGDENSTQRPVPAMQVTVYNDGPERSRLVVDLAAIQASSIYTISPMGSFVPFGGGSTGGGTTSTSTSTTAPPPATTTGREKGMVGGGRVQRPTGTFNVTGGGGTRRVAAPSAVGFLVRSPEEALMVAGVLLLFGGAGAAVFRRRTLIETLLGKED